MSDAVRPEWVAAKGVPDAVSANAVASEIYRQCDLGSVAIPPQNFNDDLLAYGVRVVQAP